MNFLKLIPLIFFCISFEVNAKTCDEAFKSGSQSPSTGDVMDAIDTCKKDKEAACVEYVTANSDGPNTGDGRYVSAACELLSAYGANRGANNGKAVKKCEDAKVIALKQSSVAKVSAATALCEKETTKFCAKNSDGTGDGRLITAVCMLNAAYGAYKNVSSQPLSIDHQRPADIGTPAVQ